MDSKSIRSQFINFFKEQGHTYAKPAPVVPQNDPTILFINAGMNQFKDIFLGKSKRDYTRAVNSQACIRVSGKHNDLEEVGLDTTHLTSFEMLGNWSFGDYYKKEAIVWAWQLLSGVYKIPKDKLYATVFETDDESAELWAIETDINKEHIIKCGKKDNFWEMGNIGPCGPCSELHVDLGSDGCDRQGEDHVCEVNGVCNRYVELWNLVFIQYNREEDGSLKNLPATHVDTGAGLERIVAYLQNTTSVYETDIFQPIIQKVAELTNVQYEDTLKGMSHRVIADHVRTVTLAISDNVIPSNEGRGYVIRRLIRRALRYSKKLGVDEPVLHKLVGTVINVMKDYQSEIETRKDYVETLIKAEEESFLRTLESGIAIFEDISKKILAENKKEIPGAAAFKLYDTFGFPIDLTEVMAREKGLSVNMADFQIELQRQKERSRGSRKQAEFKGTDAPIGGEARFAQNEDEKLKMARHHTGTHLMNAALRAVLGDHVSQAGSFVDIDRLRFDFSHFMAMTPDEVKKVEELVNQQIKNNTPMNIFEKPIDEAKALGALSFFGEKYDDIVKVVKIGDFSMELCGGTHVENTSDIEEFKIISESAIAAGTRRIEAIAGSENIAGYLVAKKKKIIKEVELRLNQTKKIMIELTKLDPNIKVEEPGDLSGKSLEALSALEQNIIEENKSLEKKLNQLKEQAAAKNVSGLLAAVNDFGAIKTLYKVFDNYDMKMLRTISDNLVNIDPTILMLLVAIKDGKAAILARSPKVAQEKGLDAVSVIKKLTAITGGGGGGKPDIAQAGGADSAKVEAALAQVQSDIEADLK
jgi:alanyl-tRNA synthetase